MLVFHERERLRSGLIEMLGPYHDILVIGEAETAEAAVEESRRLYPDVVLMDVEMPLLDGAECIRRIRATGTGTQVVLLSIYLGQHRILEAVRAGANAYVSSDWSPDDLADAIRAAYTGGTRIPSEIANQLLRTERLSNDALLTPREGEILRLLALGMRNRDIAAQLWISEGTVKFHLTNLYQKLDATTRTQAVHEARRRGMLP